MLTCLTSHPYVTCSSSLFFVWKVQSLFNIITIMLHWPIYCCLLHDMSSSLLSCPSLLVRFYFRHLCWIVQHHGSDFRQEMGGVVLCHAIGHPSHMTSKCMLTDRKLLEKTSVWGKSLCACKFAW
jgi:hypothetical protein